jgi:predicted adenylyl cyclase CyaB
MERELKFACPDLEALRESLRDLAAERLGPAGDEDNRIYDRQAELYKADKLLRLREDRKGAHLAYKGPADITRGVKTRVEIETMVDSADHAHEILEALGYKVVRRYEKKREEWRLGGVTVALDRTPIGDFAEFEGEGGDRVAVRCGFEIEDAETRNYLEIYDDYLRENPDAPPDMLFP